MNEESKRVVVTGGSKGIGKAAVLRFLAAGYRVWTCAREKKALADLIVEVPTEYRGRLVTEILDLGDIEAVKACFRDGAFLADGLDSLVCNAAYQSLGHAMEFCETEMDRSYRVNILSPILTMQSCYPALKRREGNIIYVGSVADSRYSNGFSLYGATKAFMNSFIKHASKDTGPDGVRVNVVTPGATATPMLEASLEKTGDTGFIKEIGLRRLGAPDEIAAAIFFASEQTSYLHGSDLRIHGGIF